MLESMRKRASGWAVKAFLGLLILSFAAWGIGDVVRSGAPSQIVAEVDGLPVSGVSLRREAEARYEQLLRQFGGNLPRDAQLMASLTDEALRSAIARRLIDAHARALGLAVADETLARRVREEPAFQTAGAFDRQRLDMFLRSSGQDEPTFLAQVRSDLVRSDLVAGLLAPVSGSTLAAGILDASRNELRAGRALVVDAVAQAVAEPDDATLQAHLAAHEREFWAPELRTVEIALLDTSDILDEVAVDDSGVAAEYAAHPERFRTPERRDAVQLVAADEAVLRDARDRIAAGASFEAVADELGPRGLVRTDLDGIVRGVLPEPVDAALFALQPGAVSDIVVSPFGAHLLRLQRVHPEEVRSLDAARDEIAAELRQRLAAERLPDIATRLDDALAGGASLEAAAAEAGARRHVMVIDRAGLGPDGLTVVEPALPSATLAEIFAAEPGLTSLVRADAEGRYQVFAVREVVPAKPRTLEQARPQVLLAWRGERQRDLAKAEAERLLARARAGEPLDALATGTPGARIVEIEPLRRAAEGGVAGLGEAARTALFATPAGSVASEAVAVNGGYAILQTGVVIPADPARGGEASLRQLRAEMANDLAQSYEAALRQRFTVTTNESAYAALLPAASSSGTAP